MASVLVDPKACAPGCVPPLPFATPLLSGATVLFLFNILAKDLLCHGDIRRAWVDYSSCEDDGWD